MPTRPRVTLAIVLTAALAACKLAGEPSRAPLAAGGAASFGLLADDTRLLCPCAELVPITARPAFPRIRGTARGPVPLQDECVYLPASGDGEGARLAVSVRKTTRKLAFDEAQALSGEVKIVARERRSISSEGPGPHGGGAEVPFFMAVVSNRAGSERIAVAHAVDETLLIESRETIAASDEAIGAPPAYFDGLPERILVLCR
jgi:hypothetical protein